MVTKLSELGFAPNNTSGYTDTRIIAAVLVVDVLHNLLTVSRIVAVAGSIVILSRFNPVVRQHSVIQRTVAINAISKLPVAFQSPDQR